jgi:hypothetical protein
MRSTLFSLGLLTTLAVAPARAQTEAPLLHLVARAPVTAPQPVADRIFTLAWTDITLPANIARSPNPSSATNTAPASYRFVLTWQEVSAAEAPAEAAPKTPVVPTECRVVTLVSLPC